MSWLKFDDAFPEHPKIERVGGDAGWLYVCATAYSSRQRTDGFVTKTKLQRLSDRKNVPKLLAAMVNAGLMHAPGHTGCESEACPAHYLVVPEGEYLIHDYWENNHTRAEQEEKDGATSAKRSEAGKAGAHARWHKDSPRDDCDLCIADGKRDGKAMANAWQKDGPDPTRPDPTSTDLHTQQAAATQTPVAPAAAAAGLPPEVAQCVDLALRVRERQSKTEIRNPKRWADTVRQGIAADHAEAFAAALATAGPNPDLSLIVATTLGVSRNEVVVARTGGGYL